MAPAKTPTDQGADQSDSNDEAQRKPVSQYRGLGRGGTDKPPPAAPEDPGY
jgi:hypothetical protein